MFKYLLVATVWIITISCGQDTPLSEFQPKSGQEKELKKVLLIFQSGANAKDPAKIADLLHAEASLMTGRDRKIISKAEYVSILPKRLAENPPLFLGKPKIKISGDEAEVKVYMRRGNARILMIYQMCFDNDKWYIKSWKY